MKYWLIHAGDYGEAGGLFLEDGIIAINWRIGDLELLPTDWKSFKNAFVEWSQKVHQESQNPQDYKPRSIDQDAGTNYRFVHRLAIGDAVVFAPKKAKKPSDPNLYLGHVETAYFFNPTPHSDPRLNTFKHQRQVTWIASKPRAQFSAAFVHLLGHCKGALCEIKAVYHPELAATFKS